VSRVGGVWIDAQFAQELLDGYFRAGNFSAYAELLELLAASDVAVDARKRQRIRVIDVAVNGES
jgi:hypothetical protein